MGGGQKRPVADAARTCVVADVARGVSSVLRCVTAGKVIE